MERDACSCKCLRAKQQFVDSNAIGAPRFSACFGACSAPTLLPVTATSCKIKMARMCFSIFPMCIPDQREGFPISDSASAWRTTAQNTLLESAMVLGLRLLRRRESWRAMDRSIVSVRVVIKRRVSVHPCPAYQLRSFHPPVHLWNSSMEPQRRMHRFIPPQKTASVSVGTFTS